MARTYDEALHILQTHSINTLTLDHDLGENVDGVSCVTGIAY